MKQFKLYFVTVLAAGSLCAESFEDFRNEIKAALIKNKTALMQEIQSMGYSPTCGQICQEITAAHASLPESTVKTHVAKYKDLLTASENNLSKNTQTFLAELQALSVHAMEQDVVLKESGDNEKRSALYNEYVQAVSNKFNAADNNLLGEVCLVGHNQDLLMLLAVSSDIAGCYEFMVSCEMSLSVLDIMLTREAKMAYLMLSYNLEVF